MLTRVLSVGLLAGFLAGLLIAVLQQVTTTPLILVAETYEKQSEAASAAPPAAGTPREHDHAAHDHEWKPADGLPRFFFTSIATIATAVGISFLLIAGMIFAGDAIDERRSLAWAIAGFVASGLAPAAGLAPELPGSAAGDLVARQIWWIATAVATGAGAVGVPAHGKSRRAARRVRPPAGAACDWRAASACASKARCRPRSPRSSPPCRSSCKACCGRLPGSRSAFCGRCSRRGRRAEPCRRDDGNDLRLHLVPTQPGR